MSDKVHVVEFIKPQDTFVEAHISDTHFGIIDPAKEFQILKEQFLDKECYTDPYIWYWFS